ncbi:Conserved oligomeric Golgi complex subunit 4 [Nakaseomyces bracarensis]|uniref:Conserved oligomeric Golgi complex subunit 4 n=1 Tax=Nakaseomyces bracarensis TaxID=273131 RepID=A0ABR4NY84_9SACH
MEQDSYLNSPDSIDSNRLAKNLARYDLLLRRISTVSQVNKLRDIIEKDHAAHVKKLDQYVNESQSRHNRQIRKLELQRTDLTVSLTQFHDTLSVVNKTNSQAQNIHDDIETVEVERCLVKQTLQYVTDIRTLKNNILLCHSVLAEGDYQVAARAIQEIHNLPNKDKIINSEFSKKVIPSSKIPWEPAVILEQWCTQLTDVFKTRFIKATEDQNVEELTLIFKMFPMVGQDNLGLDLYSKYVCDIIAEESRKLLSGVANANADSNIIRRPGFFSQVLLHLFKIVSTIINEHFKIIAASYGVSYMVHVMAKVQKEADLQAGLVLDIFNDTRKIPSVIKEINEWNVIQTKNRSKSPPATDSNKEEDSNPGRNSTDMFMPAISTNDLSGLVNEFSQILQNWSMYLKFYSVRWNEFSNLKPEILTPPPTLQASKFASKLKEEHYLDNFLALIFFNLQRSFGRSKTLEELPQLNDLITNTVIKTNDALAYPVSSVVEDLTLLLRKSLVSTVNSGNFQVLSQFLEQLIRFAQNDFLVRFMQDKFKSLQPKITSSLTLKKYVPKEISEVNSPDTPSRVGSPMATNDKGGSNKLSQFSKFSLRGAAATAFTNIQSNLQAVVIDEDSVLALHHYLIYLNTLNWSSIFCHRLLSVEILEDNPRLLFDNFPFNEDAQILKERIIKSEEMIMGQISKLQKWAVKYLFQNVLQNKMKAILTPLFINGNESNYIANAENFEDMSLMSVFVRKWTELITPYQNILHPDVFSELISRVVDFCVQTLEQKFYALQVNELGATKLEKELSLFISTVCSLNFTMRKEFTKLTQMVLLLGFDDDDFELETGDIKEELMDSIDWVLTAVERVNIRKMKVDRRK